MTANEPHEQGPPHAANEQNPVAALFDVSNGSIYPDEHVPDTVGGLQDEVEWEELLDQSSLGTPTAKSLQEHGRRMILQRRADILFRGMMQQLTEDDV